jgi:signal transduction histidine kinase/CheY-like chemotaxis protein/HPt (histidine-containing phosphotransfer) domain-containing protein
VQLNAAYRIRGINAEGARLLGQPTSTLPGKSFPAIWSRLTDLDSSTIERQLNTVAQSRRPLPGAPIRLRHGTARSVPVEWTCLAADNAGGLGLVVSVRDLTHEEELLQERDRLAAIAEESPSPVIELDRHANVLYANPAMTAWLAKLGHGADGFPKVVPRALPMLVEQCLRSGEPIQHEEVLLPEASFSWTFCPVVTHGLVRGYALDMTQIHETQQMLRRAAEQLQDSNRRLDQALTSAQESARVKAAFLATVSHELRTPMNGVIGMTSLLMETSLSPEQRSYADTIRQCGEALLHLINDVLECSKIEAGKLELERLDFNLRTTVEDVLAQFAERAEAKGLELTGLVHAAVPTALRGDPGRLRQVLTNLVGNAVKFTEQGEVTLQAYLESDASDAAVVRFEVTDSGIGIAPDTQAKLFRPFVQADSSTTRKYGGTGLGLSISKQLIELMGGQIGVKSTSSQGSTFWCTVPFLKQPSSPRAILPTGDLEGRRVLIVDDNESNRMILHHLVTGWGMIDELAEDAATALKLVTGAKARSVSYDLAILDVMMPEKDGLQLARELRQHPAGAGIRIVVMTSLLQRGHAEQARQAGAMGYLPKPVRHDQLRECLRTVLGISRVSTEDPLAPSPILPQLVTRHTLAEHVARQRILVVEDNIVNQKLAVRMAEKLGYQPDVVGNGEEALAALARLRYAAILMDCQMPIMDGFEATKAIRERESAGLGARGLRQGDEVDTSPLPLAPSLSPTFHIPIIAVTANAMQGDRERCLAAGMNDYLAKPVKLDALRAVLQRWVATPAAPPPAVASDPFASSQDNDRGIFDPAKMFQNIGRDNELFGQLVRLFLDQYQAMLADIKEGLIQTDAMTVERAAHTLKGTAGNLCASEVALAASRLEAVGHLGTLQEAPPVYAQLEMEVLRLVRILGSYQQGYETITQSAA